MADSINGTAAVSSLLRAQIQAPITATKSSQDAALQLINQLQKSTAPAKSTAVTLTSKSLGITDNLPRGSLVDITA